MRRRTHWLRFYHFEYLSSLLGTCRVHQFNLPAVTESAGSMMAPAAPCLFNLICVIVTFLCPMPEVPPSHALRSVNLIASIRWWTKSHFAACSLTAFWPRLSRDPEAPGTDAENLPAGQGYQTAILQRTPMEELIDSPNRSFLRQLPPPERVKPKAPKDADGRRSVRQALSVTAEAVGSHPGSDMYR